MLVRLGFLVVAGVFGWLAISCGPTPVAVSVQQACDNQGKVNATFQWLAKAQGNQWLDVSTQNNGFAPGTFGSAGPLPNGTASYSWGGLSPATNYYWRVNTQTGSGWATSNTASFSSLTCMPPVKACIGYMAQYTTSGRAECEQIIAEGGALGNCVAGILGVGGNKGACASVTGDGYMVDCLLGLSGQSHFGLTSCRVYYNS